MRQLVSQQRTVQIASISLHPEVAGGAVTEKGPPMPLSPRMYWAAALLAITAVTAGCSHDTKPEAAGSEATVSASIAVAEPTNTDVNGNGRPDSDPSDTDWPGRMTVVYEDASTPEAVAGRQFMETNNLLPQLADDINNTLKLPHDITLKGSQCGQPNDFWSPGDNAITMCYEDASNSVDVFTKLGDADPQKSAFHTELEAFYHETGHMVVDIYDLPTTGRDEDVADQASAYLLFRPNAEGVIDADSIEAIRDTARWYEASSGEVDDGALADVHSPDKARMYNFECWAYGADPGQSADLVSDGLLPKDRADGCEGEYAQLEKAWSTLLDPYLK